MTDADALLLLKGGNFLGFKERQTYSNGPQRSHINGDHRLGKQEPTYTVRMIYKISSHYSVRCWVFKMKMMGKEAQDQCYALTISHLDMANPVKDYSLNQRK